jgi:uracil-DNA glycosylase family 4
MARKTKSDRRRAVRAAVEKLEDLQRAGLTHLGKPPQTQPRPGTEGASPALTHGDPRGSRDARRGSPDPAGTAPAPSPAQDDPRVVALGELARRVAVCTRCKELVGNRTQTVFGMGNPYARLVFLGEAPGLDEDRQGEPFVGAAGQLLNRILAACGLRREEVYILNILKCRPPGNRNPLAAEAANCREYLDRQLEIIRPEFICCLGSVAAQNLLDTSAPIGKLRGRFHDYQGIKVLCTYHPAYLLRTPSAKRQTWEDMQRLMAEMGIELPKKQGG